MQNWRKGVCFWSCFPILERTWWKKLRKAYRNMYVGSIFEPAKYVLRVCFESPWWYPAWNTSPLTQPWFHHPMVYSSWVWNVPQGTYSIVEIPSLQSLTLLFQFTHSWSFCNYGCALWLLHYHNHVFILIFLIVCLSAF